MLIFVIFYVTLSLESCVKCLCETISLSAKLNVRSAIERVIII